MNILVKIFSSVVFPLIHQLRGAFCFFQLFHVGSDSHAHAKHSKVFHLVIFFLVFQPFVMEFAFARTSEMADEVTPREVMLRELAYNEDVKGGFSGFKLLEIKREGFRKFGVGSSELLPVVSLSLDDGFNQFPAKVADNCNRRELKKAEINSVVLNINELIGHEPLAFATLLLVVSYWCCDIIWKLGTLLWGYISLRL